MIGAKCSTETADCIYIYINTVVGERSIGYEAEGVTHRGAYGSDNVGTSNRIESEILSRRNTKVSVAMKISRGLVGPKPIPKGGGDGHTVNIP